MIAWIFRRGSQRNNRPEKMTFSLKRTLSRTVFVMGRNLNQFGIGALGKMNQFEYSMNILKFEIRFDKAFKESMLIQGTPICSALHGLCSSKMTP